MRDSRRLDTLGDDGRLTPIHAVRGRSSLKETWPGRGSIICCSNEPAEGRRALISTVDGQLTSGVQHTLARFVAAGSEHGF